MASNYYSVKTGQILLASILSALISAGSIAAFVLYNDRLGLPLVQTDDGGKCVQVINYKNGDAYNCQDVDILLRQYRKAPISAGTSSGMLGMFPTSGTAIPASAPVASSQPIQGR
jgi:hypothetical protein